MYTHKSCYNAKRLPTLYDWLSWPLYLSQILHTIYCFIEHITCTSSGCHNIPQAHFNSVQSLSRVRLLASPWTDCCMPGFPFHHQLPELTQTHVHRVSDAILPSHPLSSPSPPAFSLAQNQGLFQWVCSSHQVAKGLELQLQHQEYSWWIFKTDFL